MNPMCEYCHKQIVRWWIYNAAFRVFGRTRYWGRMAGRLWR